MPTARSGKLDSARSLAAADTTGTLLRFVPPKKIAGILSELAYAFRKRFYTPMVTVCMMVLQALDEDSSQRKAVAATMTARRAKGCTTSSSDPSGYCSARKRLRLSLLVRLVDAVATRLQDAARPHCWIARSIRPRRLPPCMPAAGRSRSISITSRRLCGWTCSPPNRPRWSSRKCGLTSWHTICSAH